MILTNLYWHVFVQNILAHPPTFLPKQTTEAAVPPALPAASVCTGGGTAGFLAVSGTWRGLHQLHTVSHLMRLFS